MTNPKADAYVAKAEKWRDEFAKMREIALGCAVTEDFKWGHPCYTVQGANVVLIHGFKDYCAFLFHKGSLMKDPAGILIQQTENVQAGRQVRFTSLRQIIELEATLKAYIEEAIALETSGAKVPFKTAAEFAVTEEFQNRLDEDPNLKEAFEALTPGRRKGYLLHFSGAKQAKTRQARVEKCIPRIFDGLGLDD